MRAIAYMEAIVRPMAWEEWPGPARSVFEAMRSDAGEAMILEKNIFVERILPGSILRKLSEAEMAEYRRPFLNPGEDRRPTLTWPRQIPLGGEPARLKAVGYSQSPLTGLKATKLELRACLLIGRAKLPLSRNN